MRLLFIGGVADGEVHEVSDEVACGRFPMKVPVKIYDSNSVFRDNTAYSTVMEFPTDTYQCERIRGIYSECRVMVYTKLTIDQTLRMLIDNYHPTYLTDIST